MMFPYREQSHNTPPYTPPPPVLRKMSRLFMYFYNNKIHTYFKCVYAYGKLEPGGDHTPGAYNNIGASPDLGEYR
jgi:hypothetical protein